MSIIYLVKVPYHYSLLFLISSFFFFTSRVNSISFSLLSSLLSFDFTFHHYFSFFLSSIISSLSSSFFPFPSLPLSYFPSHPFSLSLSTFSGDAVDWRVLYNESKEAGLLNGQRLKKKKKERPKEQDKERRKR